MKELNAVLQAFAQAVNGLVKYPLAWCLVISIAGNIWLLTRLFAQDDKHEMKMTRVYEKADSVYTIAVTALDQKSILKDTIINMKDRDYQQLLEQLRK